MLLAVWQVGTIFSNYIDLSEAARAGARAAALSGAPTTLGDAAVASTRRSRARPVRGARNSASVPGMTVTITPSPPWTAGAQRARHRHRAVLAQPLRRLRDARAHQRHRRHARASAGRMRRLSMRRERGQTAVEFALCATVFFMIVFGLLKVADDLRRLRRAAARGPRRLAQGLGHARHRQRGRHLRRSGRHDRGAGLRRASSTPTKMGITVTGLDSNVNPNGTLWEAHDRVQVTVTYPWKLDVIGLHDLVGHDVDDDPGDHRVAVGAARGALRRQGCRRSCGQRASSWLRPVTGTSSARQSAVSTACLLGAGEPRAQRRRAAPRRAAARAPRAAPSSARRSAGARARPAPARAPGRPRRARARSCRRPRVSTDCGARPGSATPRFWPTSQRTGRSVSTLRVRVPACALMNAVTSAPVIGATRSPRAILASSS